MKNVCHVKMDDIFISCFHFSAQLSASVSLKIPRQHCAVCVYLMIGSSRTKSLW